MKVRTLTPQTFPWVPVYTGLCFILFEHLKCIALIQITLWFAFGCFIREIRFKMLKENKTYFFFLSISFLICLIFVLILFFTLFL